eukprot:scaffold12890_cov52-Attheya_sp.AAC.6
MHRPPTISNWRVGQKCPPLHLQSFPLQHRDHSIGQQLWHPGYNLPIGWLGEGETSSKIS